MFGARPQLVTLTTNTAQTVQAAPGAGKAIHVLELTVSHDHAAPCTFTISEGSTDKFKPVLTADGDTEGIDLGEGGWILPENTALKATQSINAGTAYVTAMTRIIPAQELQN